MKKITLNIDIQLAQIDELPEEDQQLVKMAIEQTEHSYSPYSHFSVGAALRLENGMTVRGCNQENAAFSVTICAERSALFAAGAAFPDQAVTTLAIAANETDVAGKLTEAFTSIAGSIAIAARNENHELLEEPISPCGTCRQAIIETETRFKRPVRILLYGKKHIYVLDSIKALMPLSFTEY